MRAGWISLALGALICTAELAVFEVEEVGGMFVIQVPDCSLNPRLIEIDLSNAHITYTAPVEAK